MAQLTIRHALDRMGFGLFVVVLVIIPFAMSYGIWTYTEIGGPVARASLVLFSWVLYGAFLRGTLFGPSAAASSPTSEE